MTVRRILSIFLVLGVLLSLFGCTPSETGDPTESESGSESGTESGGDEYDPTGDDKAFELDAELVANLEQYWRKLGMMINIVDPPPTFKENIESLTTSNCLVRFDSSERYYACLYSNAQSGTWVGFRNPEEIKENYLGLTLIFAAQVNVTSDVTRASGDTQENIRMYYYNKYTPKFENGFNVCSAEQVRPFIYLEDFEGDVIYYGRDSRFSSYYELGCFESDGEIYILITTRHVSEDGTITTYDPRDDLGKHYDDLADLIVPDVYIRDLTINSINYTYTSAGVKVQDIFNVLGN